MEDDVKAEFAALHESIKSLYRMDGQQAEQISALDKRLSTLEKAYNTTAGFIDGCKIIGQILAWAAGISSALYGLYEIWRAWHG